MSNEHLDLIKSNCLETLGREHFEKLNQESCISMEVAKLANLTSMASEEVFKKFGHSSVAIRFPYWSLMFNDWKGDYRVRFDNPKIVSNTGKRQRYSQPKDSSTTLYCLPSDVVKINNINIPLIWTEGEKKHLSIRSHKFSEKYAVISAPGCWGYISDGEVSKEYDCIPLKNREVFFVGDNDLRFNENIFNGYKKLIEYFISRGAFVNLVDLGEKAMIANKCGADDFLKEFGEREFIERMNNPIVKLANPEWLLTQGLCDDEFFAQSACASDEQFEVLEKKITGLFGINRGQLRKKLKKAKNQFNLLCDPDDKIFYDDTAETNNQYTERASKKISKRHNLLILKNTLLVVDYEKREVQFLSSTKSLKGFLRSAINVSTWNRNYEVGSMHFQQDCIDQIKYSPKKYFKDVDEVESIVNVPYVFGQDQELLNGVFDNICHLSKPLSLDYVVDKDTNPLFKVLNYLPFKTEGDRDDFLGCLIGLFFIPYHLGDHPMLIIKGDAPGNGKSTLSEIIDTLVNHEPSGALSFKSNEEELEKQISTKLLRSSVVIIDNIRSDRPVSSPVLERCVSEKVLTFRELGSQNTLERANDCLFVLTLNGGTFSGDLLDRSIVIELAHEKKKKEAFPHSGQISDYVKKHKDEILQTLAIMIRKSYFHESFSDRQYNLHRFNDFANKIKNIMAANGYTFLENSKEKSMSSDPLLIALVRLTQEEKGTHLVSMAEIKKSDSEGKNFFYYPKSASDIVEEIKIRKYEFQNDLQSAMLGKQLQRLASQGASIVEYDDERFKVEIECVKSGKGGRNKSYSVKSSLIEAGNL